MKVVEIGMVVRVSGIESPEMVVAETFPLSDNVRCVWFNVNEDVQTANFHARILERVEDK